MCTQIAEIQELVDAAQEVLGRNVVFQIERVEQVLLSPGSCPIMLFAPALTDRVILPAAQGGLSRAEWTLT